MLAIKSRFFKGIQVLGSQCTQLLLKFTAFETGCGKIEWCPAYICFMRLPIIVKDTVSELIINNVLCLLMCPMFNQNEELITFSVFEVFNFSREIMLPAVNLK
jgi:hypothetical protein